MFFVKFINKCKMFKFKCFEDVASKNIIKTLVLNLIAVGLIPLLKLLEGQKFEVLEIVIQLLIVLVTFISSYLIIKDSFETKEAVIYFASIIILVFVAQYYIRDKNPILIIIATTIYMLVLLVGIINSYKYKKKCEEKESKENLQKALVTNDTGGIKL